MPHFTFEPMKELELLSQRMRKFADEFPESFSVEYGKGYNPRVDVMHDDKNVYAYVELPGVAREDVSLSIKENVLYVSGEKKQLESESTKATLTERAYGPFSREIALPEKVDRGSVKAKLDAGILVVTIAKAVPDSAKEVTIEIG